MLPNKEHSMSKEATFVLKDSPISEINWILTESGQ